MGGGADHVTRAAFLNDSPAIHDRNAVGDFNRRAEIMRDENHRQAQLSLQLAQEQKHLDLHRGIECGGGFIGEQQLGSTGERKCDHGPLAHAAGHLVRVGGQPALRAGDADPLKQFQGALVRVGCAHGFMPADGLHDLIAQGIDRIQGRERLLKDHGHTGTAIIGERAAAERHHIGAVDHHLPANPGGLRCVQAHETAQGDAFAGS